MWFIVLSIKISVILFFVTGTSTEGAEWSYNTEI